MTERNLLGIDQTAIGGVRKTYADGDGGLIIETQYDPKRFEMGLAATERKRNGYNATAKTPDARLVGEIDYALYLQIADKHGLDISDPEQQERLNWLILTHSDYSAFRTVPTSYRIMKDGN